MDDKDREAVGQEITLPIARDGSLLRVVPQARASWEAQFARMAEQGDDILLDDDVPWTNAWDEHEWAW